MESQSKNPLYELRILFGPMYGVDLLLPCQDQIFISVSANDTISNDENRDLSAQHLAINSLFIPHYRSGLSFRISFRNQSKSSPDVNSTPDNPESENDSGDFTVEWMDHNDFSVCKHHFNDVCRFNEIAFSIKHSNRNWSPAVLSFRPEREIDQTNLSDAVDVPLSRNRRRITFPVCVVVAVIFLTTSVLFSMFARAETKRDMTQFFLDGPSRNYVFFKDGKTYVVAETDAGADWDRQRALRMPAHVHPYITSINAEQDKATTLLAKHDIDFFTISFEKIDEPELIMVDNGQASADQPKARLATSLLQEALPFATGLHIRSVNLATVEADAEAQLDRIPVLHTKIHSDGYVTFFIKGFVSDYALSALTKLAKNFSDDWGHRKIRFSLELRTTGLNGKPHQTGEDSYVLVDPNHWYFENSI